MVKSGLILVVLVLGYLNTDSALAKATNDELDFLKDELLPIEEQIPTNIAADYQNDENYEGSGSVDEDIEDIVEQESEDTDKASPVDVVDAVSKEKDESIASTGDEEAQDNEEVLDVPQVVNDINESIQEETDDLDSEEKNESVAEANNNEDVDETVKVDEEALDIPEVNEESNQNNTSETEEKDKNEDQIDEDQSSNEQESSEKVLPIPIDTNPIVDTNTDDDKVDTDTQDKPADDSSSVPSELETPEETAPQEDKHVDDSSSVPSELEAPEEAAPQEIETDKTADKEQHTSNIVLSDNFANEKDLPAERFGKQRGLGKSMPMQDAAVPTIEQVDVVREPEVQRNAEVIPDSDKKEVQKDNKNGKVVKGKLEEGGDKELPDTGASEASSSSNTVTFVIILGLVAVVGVVGYLVHKRRRNHQRATPVPTHEDRELKEVKTHRLDDDGFNGNGQKIVSHIPEANPLILTDKHLKGGYDCADTDKNGYLPAQQNLQLSTFLSPNNAPAKPKHDDIRMMDDDVEDDTGAERRPLVTDTVATSNNEQVVASKVDDEVKQSTGANVED